jgi:mono/diheme cytochrome c family protein
VPTPRPADTASPSPRRRGSRAVALALALVGLVAIAGCDLQEDADLDRGRELFIQRCGTCHQLAEAATQAETGPNLDAAFVAARERGNDQDTIEGVVQAQIANPRPASPSQTNLYMPADLVTGDDAEDVAAYVASVAGVPGIEPPEAPGGEGGNVWAEFGCASCHTLEAAGASGTTGPNLDETLAGQSAKDVEESIVNPSGQIVSGFQDVMPDNYEQQIPAADLEALVQFLLDSTGGASGNGG